MMPLLVIYVGKAEAKDDEWIGKLPPHTRVYSLRELEEQISASVAKCWDIERIAILAPADAGEFSAIEALEIPLREWRIILLLPKVLEGTHLTAKSLNVRFLLELETADVFVPAIAARMCELTTQKALDSN